jgi:iron complex outermembrane receptor protein
MLNTYQFSDRTKYDSNPTETDPNIYSDANDYKQTQRGIKSEFRADGTTFAWMAGIDLRDNDYKSEAVVLSELDRYDRLNVGDTSTDNKTDEDVRAFYGELKYKATDKLIFTGNVRNDHIELDYKDKLEPTKDGDEVFDIDSFRLGVNYAFQKNLDLYANASTGFRTPTVTQLFTGSDSPSHRSDPNPDLDPEESLNLEIGIRMNTSLFGIAHDIDASIFQLDRDDYIQSTAGQYTTSADNMYDNIGDVRNRGFELALNSDMSKMISWDIAYTYLDAEYTKYDNFNLQTAPIAGSCPPGSTEVRNTWPPFSVSNCLTAYDNEGNQVPRTPNHKLNAIVRIRPAKHWTISTEMQAQSSYYVDEINQEEINGRAIFNLWANYDRQIGNADWTFFARIDNLFDRDYYNNIRASGDSNDDGVYDSEDPSITVNPGIVFSTGLSVRF